RLHLEGFSYNQMSGDHQATVDQRLAWIRSQYHQPSRNNSWEGFTPQPYEQLSAAYQRVGQDVDARKVAIARRSDRRKYDNLNRSRAIGDWILDKTIQYGYRTSRAAVGLAVVYVIVVALSMLAQHRGVIVPVGTTAGLHTAPAATICTSDYPCFYPAGYAI